ncbi:MAG: hypothetical protein PVF77_08255 [Anaerolineae bacterium]|jgi:hypothetical protein
MSEKSYRLASDEKVNQVMVGTQDALIWGDLVTKKPVRISVYLNTMADEFVSLNDVRILFLAPEQRVPPTERPELLIKQEEILAFFALDDPEPIPEETETRRYVPIEMFVGSYQIEGKIIKAPVSTLHNMLVVTRSVYLPIYEATIHHVAKPWLGSFASSIVHIRRERMNVVIK